MLDIVDQKSGAIVNKVSLRRVARPFAFPCHRILPARHSNATPVHSLRVRILNLGCPVLDARRGEGGAFGAVGHAQIVKCSFR
jgi:hypothetical protein